MEWEQAKPDQTSNELPLALRECQQLREKCRQAREAYQQSRVKLLEAMHASQELRRRLSVPGNN